MTRREWLRRAAGTVVAAGLPALFGRRAGALAKRRHGNPDNITGRGSLASRAAARGMLAGAAVDTRLLRTDDTYRQVLAEQYNILVGENCMKFGATQPRPETYYFNDADGLVSFAESNGMKVRGHNFVWHEALPEWFAGTVTKENAEKILVDHIMTVGGRFKGRIHSWDVVNEAIWIPDGRPDGLRSSSPWFQMLGPDYIDFAYRTAREADPKALLTYNDYGIEYDNGEEAKKRAAVLDLLKRMKAAGTPIDALGVQSHLNAASTSGFGSGLRELLDGARSLGLQVFVTELDVKDDGLEVDDVAKRDEAVAGVYRDYLGRMLEGREVKAVLTWGVSDAHTWLNGAKWREKHPDREQRPLPFDDQYSPTPAFFALRESFDNAKRR
ncbi:endo-1,4-beta-xylanase [Edaphobacter bradus]|uniref:endo-1,4-beta-xylanase n=1 Tax=Edaphobacter bradus TaxID=2259016 RepID=UPI0021DFFCCC|nr:endo-1,4-beta-xylanase [Edaphobacter bradus]